MQRIDSKKYAQMVENVTPRINFLKTGTAAFFVGGFVCCLGEVFRLFFLSLKINKTDVGVLVSLILMFISAMLTWLGLFHNIAKFGGAGTFVPITGFANSVVSPAIEFKTEGLLLGVTAQMFVIAGPVIVCGVVSAMIFGIVFQLGLWFGVIA